MASKDENSEMTTIKLSKETKQRLDHIKEYKRETYEEILQKMLEILNISRVSPLRARARLIAIDRKKGIQQKRIFKMSGKPAREMRENREQKERQPISSSHKFASQQQNH